MHLLFSSLTFSDGSDNSDKLFQNFSTNGQIAGPFSTFDGLCVNCKISSKRVSVAVFVQGTKLVSHVETGELILQPMEIPEKLSL